MSFQEGASTTITGPKVRACVGPCSCARCASSASGASNALLDGTYENTIFVHRSGRRFWWSPCSRSSLPTSISSDGTPASSSPTPRMFASRTVPSKRRQTVTVWTSAQADATAGKYISHLEQAPFLFFKYHPVRLKLNARRVLLPDVSLSDSNPSTDRFDGAGSQWSYPKHVSKPRTFFFFFLASVFLFSFCLILCFKQWLFLQQRRLRVQQHGTGGRELVLDLCGRQQLLLLPSVSCKRLGAPPLRQRTASIGGPPWQWAWAKVWDQHGLLGVIQPGGAVRCISNRE